MDRIFDEAARILASQMPRRQAFKLLGGLLAGGIVAALGGERVEAAGCTATSCKSGQKCCAGKNCRPVDEQCCGIEGDSCKSDRPCCANCTNKKPFCKTPKKTCPASPSPC